MEYPSESFETRIHILDEARERIDVSYYAMHMGESTDLFLGALLEAADRGVHIRILVDGQFGGLTYYHPAYAAAIGAHPNIELKIYNPPNVLKPWTWNGRLHDKYIIIDNRLLLMGGRNIGDKYFSPEGYDKALSYDRDVLIYNTEWTDADAGSVLFDIRDYMDSLWNSEDVRQPFSKDTKRGAAKRQALRTMFDSFRSDNPNLFDHTADDYENRTYSANRVTFFHNDTQTGPKEPKVGYVLGQLIMDANESVVLQSPYIILDQRLKELLNDLGEKQVNAEILTNSIASSPNPVACTAYFGDRKTILKTGISLREYQGNHSIHAKTYIIDDRMAIVGSYNLDPRSAYIDTEMMLAIDSADFTRHLKQVQNEYRQQALEVGNDGEYFPDSTLEARPVHFFKKVMIYILFLPVQLFKYLT
ncbi:MAG: phosphatidylserine/phosphatidylglycerophosphate/cardiolipin synthase family protein [Oscillospiraceae bacterium]